MRKELGPFRWVCLSGKSEDLAKTDAAAADIIKRPFISALHSYVPIRLIIRIAIISFKNRKFNPLFTTSYHFVDNF